MNHLTGRKPKLNDSVALELINWLREHGKAYGAVTQAAARFGVSPKIVRGYKHGRYPKHHAYLRDALPSSGSVPCETSVPA